MQKIPEIPYHEYRAKYKNMSVSELITERTLLEKLVDDQLVIINYLKIHEDDENVNKESLRYRNLKAELSTLNNIYTSKWIDKYQVED